MATTLPPLMTALLRSIETAPAKIARATIPAPQATPRRRQSDFSAATCAAELIRDMPEPSHAQLVALVDALRERVEAMDKSGRYTGYDLVAAELEDTAGALFKVYAVDAIDYDELDADMARDMARRSA